LPHVLAGVPAGLEEVCSISAGGRDVLLRNHSKLFLAYSA
jgi:hypothetical protein